MLTDILRRLQGEVTLVERAQAAERERIAHLADTWGHRTFAQFLRGQPVTGPECPDCRGIGYDASGQTCGCEDNPSFG